jgi:hypothetical protein
VSSANERPAVDIRIDSGSPTAEELAAVTAVITGIVDELSANESTRARTITTAWQRSQRTVRSAITPGDGAWRSFSG